MVARYRRFGRRRRKAALPIQTGLVLFASVMLAVAAHLNARLTPREDLGGEALFDFRVGSRRMQDVAIMEEESSGGSLRWDPWFTKDEMRHGAVLVPIAVLLYMFAGLAIVCDDFFCAALDEIVIKLDISDDVAGATFMAAGGSAPEFFTSLLGVFFFSSDVGFGTIVGSASFNVLFVIGLCAYFSGFATLPLTWYPLARDSSYYLVCLAVLLGVSQDYEITWYDSMVLCLLYIGYVLIMFFDPPIRRWAMKNLDRTGSRVNPGTSTEVDKSAAGVAVVEVTKPADSENGEKKDEDEDEEEARDGPPEWPDTPKERLLFIINAPLNFGMWATIPDCRVERLKKYYFITFWMSIAWIGGLSYVMLVMAEDIGDTLGLDDAVMGVTALAIGTSIPDAVSSLLVARDGHGDMALSSSIGSNVFDVTFGLPVPWFLSTAMVHSEPIKISSKGMSIQVGTLMFMVVIVVASIHVFGWKISKPLGLFYFGLYFGFVGIAIAVSKCAFGGVDGCD